MKQTTILIMTLFIAYAQSFAQEFKVSIGGEASFHTGIYSEFITNAYGATIRAEIPIINNVGIIITTGTIYSDKDYDIFGIPELKTVIHTNLIPIMIGSKINLSNSLYVLGEAGMNTFLLKTDDVYYVNGSIKISARGEETHESKFGWGVGVGFEMPIIEKVNLDCSAKYQTVRDNYDHFNTRLGISVAL